MKNLLLTFALCMGLGLHANTIPTTYDNVSTTKYITESDAFCTLIQHGNILAVKSMIEVGTNVNAKSNGLTPLMYAARQNKVEIVKLLLANGANIKAKGDRGLTALQWAKLTKAHDAYALLKKEQQDLKARKKAKRRMA